MGDAKVSRLWRNSAAVAPDLTLRHIAIITNNRYPPPPQSRSGNVCRGELPGKQLVHSVARFISSPILPLALYLPVMSAPALAVGDASYMRAMA